MARQPAEQTCPEWMKAAVRALSTAVSKSASANTMLGLLPPSSRATFLTLTAAPRIRARPASRPPVSDTRSTSGLSASACPTRAPGPRTRLTTPAGTPASSSRRVRWMAVSGVTGAGFMTDGVARGEGRRDLPAQLEERVVPRPDEPAHADRLVDDAADHVRVAGIDQAAGLLVGEVGVVAEDARDVGHVPAALAHRLAGVEGLERGPSPRGRGRSGRRPIEQCGALAGRRARPVGACRRRAGRRRSRPGPARRSRRPPR